MLVTTAAQIVFVCMFALSVGASIHNHKKYKPIGIITIFFSDITMFYLIYLQNWPVYFLYVLVITPPFTIIINSKWTQKEHKMELTRNGYAGIITLICLMSYMMYGIIYLLNQ